MHLHANNSDCQLYVRRAGILAAVGHDLELSVREYRVDVDVARAAVGTADPTGSAVRVRAEFDARSVHVIDAVDGSLKRRSGALSIKDKAQIDANIADEVLKVARFPLVVFESSAVEPGPDRYSVCGRLTLTGHVREIALLVRREGSDLRVDFTIHQPDFAIAPYRALGGALRLAPDVRFCFRAPGAAESMPRP